MTDELDIEQFLEAEHLPGDNGKAPEGPRPWKSVDLTAVLDGNWKAPQPSVGLRDDGAGLFYPGRSHTVIAETEGGKTWFALCASLDEMHAGNHVVYLDFEDDEGGVVGRLLALNADPDIIRRQFHYLRPDQPLRSNGNEADLAELFKVCRPTLAVIDGITEAMTMHGLNPLDNKEAALFGRLLPRRMARTGAAVVSLDHVVKDREGRGRYAIGAVHKLNGLDGGGYILENKRPFGMGMVGKSRLLISKDRPGQLRRNGIVGQDSLFWYGDLVLDARGIKAAISISAPHEQDESFRPTIVMERISRCIEQHSSISSKAQLEALVPGNNDMKRKAFTFLQLDGYVTKQAPYTVLKPYRNSPK